MARADDSAVAGSAPQLPIAPSRRHPVADSLWLLALSLVLTLVLLAAHSFSAAVPLLLHEWGISAAEAGLIFSAYQIGYVAAVLFLVPLTDHVPAHKVLIASAVASTLANVGFPLLAWSTLPAFLLRALAGAGLVGVYMPGIRLAAERFAGERRGTAVGVYVAAFYLGSSLSLAAAALLLPSLGWRGAYLVLALLSMLAPLIAFLLLRGSTAATPTAAPAASRAIREVVSNRPAMLIIGAYAAHAWELYIARAWLAPFLAALLVAGGADLVQASADGSAAAAVMMATGVAGVALGGMVSDWLGRVPTAATITALSAAGSFALGWLGHLPWGPLLALGIVYGFLLAADSPIYSTAITELSRPGHLGATQAAQAFLGFGAGALSPVVFGFVLDSIRPNLAWGLGFSLGGLAGLGGLVALLVLWRRPESKLMAAGRG